MTKRLKGISKKVVEEISEIKQDPVWMREKRLSAYEVFMKSSLPAWGPTERLKEIDFDEIYYYIRPGTVGARLWEDVPEDIREKYDKLGIPEGEREYLAGVGAQFESEMVYHSLREDLSRKGIIFEDMSLAVRNHEDLVKKHFGTVVATDNNLFSALNGAVWSGGSFVYIPPEVHLGVPLHNFFQMRAPSQGQFERTLIVADEGSSIEFLEGCVAPLYLDTSIHAGVVEIVVKKGAHVKYSTMQNWSKNVLNLVTKSSYVEEDGVVEWVDGNVGSGVTMKYPSMILAGPRARGQLMSLSFAGEGQVIDAGGKVFHLAPETTARIESKSIVKDGGRSTFRGDVRVETEADNCRTNIVCTALHLGEVCRSDTYPRFDVRNASSSVDHESSIFRVNEDQLRYIQSRGLDETAARGLIMGGFIDPFTTNLPLEYAVEFDRLIEMEMGDGVG